MKWKSIFALLGFIGFFFTLFISGGNSTFWNAIALGGLMVFLWILEVIPIYLTALLPLVLAIPLGILKPAELASAYGNSNVYLFLGGFILALGLEKWRVHEQIAHGILTIVGDSKPRILLGFIFSTGLISMWISNTATALMMLPMAMAIIHALPVEHQKSKFSLYLVLSIAYASSIGGMATLVGTPTNTQMAAILEQNYGITIGFFEWMKIALPISLLMLFITYVYFYFSLGKERLDLHDFKIVKKPWSTEQIRVVLVFGGVVFLWIFKDLINDLTPVKYDDENVAILGAVLLFIIPANKTKKPLLNWSDTEKLPWGILLLFGGGLALAKMLEVNGIVALLTDVLASFNNESIFVIIVAMVAITIFASELLSNIALVVICVPIVAAFAKFAGFDILQLCIPLTLAASCAFMLPMGTPPNAIVFSSGFVSMGQMARAGLVLNIIGIILISFFGIFFL